jgi:hypothetical protein
MLSVQNNFASYIAAQWPLDGLPVEFLEPNVKGNGLIVVVYFMSGIPYTNPNFQISDSQKNSYLPLGGCGVLNAGQRNLLQAWYVQSCAGGPNTVTVTETVDTDATTIILAVSVFEYSGGFGVLDTSTFTSGLAQPTMSMNLITTTVDLLFGFAMDYALLPVLTVNASSTGWTQEQSESLKNVALNPIVALLAVDKAANPGPQKIRFDMTQNSGGVDIALLVALPVGWTPPPVTPPPSPTPPASGSSLGWPTIF